MKKQQVCVTGGSGGIGHALLEQLLPNYQVKALFRSRNQASDKWVQRGCIPIWGDLSDANALTELVSGTDTVFHCAAIVTRSTYADAYSTNVDGTRRLAEMAAISGSRRLVHVSSIAVYSGTPVREDYTEEIALRAEGEMAVYSLTKLLAEQALQDVAQRSGLEYTILRPTCVYGPRTNSYTLVPINTVRSGMPIIVGDGRGLLDVVYVDDVARAMLLAALSPDCANQIFNIGNETVTAEHFYSHYARMLNRPARHISSGVLGFIARTLPRSRAEVRRGINFLIQTSKNAQKFPSSKAARVFGYAPEVSLTAGMLRTELWAKQEGLVPQVQHSIAAYGPLPFQPLSLVRPSRPQELEQIVRIAAQERNKIRAIGSLHSQSPIPETGGLCVVLENCNKLISVQGNLVTVEAGMTLRELNDALSKEGLALPAIGSIATQTVAGAISTGTHGGSIHHGSISDSVFAVTIVKVDGRSIRIDRSSELFPAIFLAMGLFGIISTVTFQCVPAFALQSRSNVRPVEEIIEAFFDIQERNLYVDMLYFPITGQVETLLINKPDENMAGISEREARGIATRGSNRPQGSPGQALALASVKALAAVVRRSNSLHASLAKRSAGRCYRTAAGRSDLVLAFGDYGSTKRSPKVVSDMEVGVAYESAREAIRAVGDYFRSIGRYPLLPVHIRCSAASDLWLSPAYQQKVCWLEFYAYPRADPLFSEMHDVLKSFQYRFHWGKATAATWEYISPKYERWDDFVRLRRAWDPNGMFLNPYLESFFDRAR